VGLILILTSIGIGYHAAKTIYLHEESRPVPLAIAIAAFSIVVKEVLFRVTHSIGKKERSPVVIANAWHHRSDALSSVAAMVGIGGAVIFPALHILDAFAALIVTVFIGRAGVLIAWDGVKDLTDTAPSEQLLRKIEDIVKTVPDVRLVHNLKARYYAKDLIVDLHAEVPREMTVGEGHRIAHDIKALLRESFPEIVDVQVHIEPEGDTSMHPEHF
jgi:cation diffusion facilitator family transporter